MSQRDANDPRSRSGASPTSETAPHGSRRVLITGSSGLVGSSLTQSLRARGHQVVRLVRAGRPHGLVDGLETAPWDPGRGQLDAGSVSGADVVIHLAGAGIADACYHIAAAFFGQGHRINGLASRRHFPDHRGNLLEFGDLRGAPAAFAGDQFILVVANRPDYHGLHHALRPD